jgi:TonB family protein
LNTHSSVSGRRRHSRFSKLNAAVMLLPMLLLPLRFACADSGGIERQLKSDYVDKVLTLRHFYGGEQLRFHADGTLQGDAEVGPWTVDAQIVVKEVRLQGGLLTIKGRRIYRYFDSWSKPQDVLNTIENNREQSKKDVEKTLRSLTVEIEIELPSGTPDQQDISSVINNVFLTQSESMSDVVPIYWRAYFAKQEGKPQAAPESQNPIYRSGPGYGTSAPRPTHQPSPEYSPEAQKLRYQGIAVLSLIVDVSGSPQDIQIERPVGLGLDEKAVAAVSKWKFKPSLKDGKPVAVAISVEIQFHLY